ncbi:MAG: NUDIX hydrolase [Solirubrobacteraceae bacterium]
MGHEFELIGSERVWEGKIISVGVERFRHADDEEVTREKVWHPGAVGILAVGDGYVWLTRQPREAAGLSDSLEIPAGKLDVVGEPPLETAKRELVEEVGVTAERWEELYEFFTSPGFSDERVWLYLATELTELSGGATPDHGERISAERWPFERLDDALRECQDSKSLIALLHVKAQLHR